MFSWGQCNHGQLGLGGIEDLNVVVPRKVSGIETAKAAKAADLISISSGGEHTAIVDADGRIFSCGSNDFDQLGRSGGSQSRFHQISALAQYTVKICVCGQRHTLAVDQWGKVFSWGADDSGQCGQNGGLDRLPTPKIIRSLGTMTVVQVAAGDKHSMALTNRGQIFVWGDNSFGQLGLGNSVGGRFHTPQSLDSLKGLPPKLIACGSHHSAIVSVSGAVYTWGRNNAGQLGHGDTVDKIYPTQVRSLRGQRVVYLSCGSEHTVALTKDGGVFSFGGGRYGQLGHGSYHNELLPRKIMELMGTTVSQIACGRKHTLALVPSRGRLYSFGLGGSGQLGRRESTANANTPQVVCGPWIALSHQDQPMKLTLISAGGDQSLAAFKPSDAENGFVMDHRKLPRYLRIKTLDSELVEACENLGEEEMMDQGFMESLEVVLQSPSCLNASFLIKNHYNCSSTNPGIDLEKWEWAFVKFQGISNSSLRDLMHSSWTSLISVLSPSPPDVEALRIYCYTLFYGGFKDSKFLDEFHVPMAMKLLSLDKNPWRVLERWFGSLQPKYFSAIVSNFKGAVVESLREAVRRGGATDKIPETNALLLILRIFNRLNIEGKRIIGDDEFYIPEISELIDLPRSYVNWIISKRSLFHETAFKQEFHICNYPFVFDAEAKTTLLQIDQAFQMQSAQQRATFEMFFNPLLDPTAVQYLVLVVHRDKLVEDTLSQIQTLPSSELKKPLRIKFEGEEAEDAGGVRKEFFLLVLKDIIDPKYGMFEEFEETRTIWFSAQNFEDPVMYFLIGVLCGLAIYNFTIINLRFPLPLYKKLLGQSTNLEDLWTLMPTVAKHLAQMLEYESPEDIEDLCLNFTVVREVFDESQVIELKEGGIDIDVTLENRQEYVDLYVDYFLNKSIKVQYQAFHSGFHKVCGGRVMELFQAHELMALVVGNENYDWNELQKNTLYKNGYSESHPTIVNFWDVFHNDLSLEDKKHFLLFLTGSDRIPILGMKALHLIIQRTNDEDFLPVAHTCFNLLDLPDYSSKEKLKSKLLQSIQCTQGFGIV